MGAFRGIEGRRSARFLRPDYRNTAAMNTSMLFEAAMLLGFGLAWPIATMRMLRSGRAIGKGLGFTVIIWAGYLAGTVSKLVAAHAPDVPLDPVFWLYLVNTVSVGVNGGLHWYLQRRTAKTRAPCAQTERILES